MSLEKYPIPARFPMAPCKCLAMNRCIYCSRGILCFSFTAPHNNRKVGYTTDKNLIFSLLSFPRQPQPLNLGALGPWGQIELSQLH